jgi:hypothetical protein
MTQLTTAITARVLLLVDAVDRASPRRVSDLDLIRLAYFADAFSDLWGLHPIERYRLKVQEPRSQLVRSALNRLVLSGVVEPSAVRLTLHPTPHLSARYRVVPAIAQPILHAIAATAVGRREMDMVYEVVYASAGLLDGSLAEAVRQDATYGDSRIGPSDLLDLGPSTGGTSATARLFSRGVASQAVKEAELTHMYMAHLERSIIR